MYSFLCCKICYINHSGQKSSSEIPSVLSTEQNTLNNHTPHLSHGLQIKPLQATSLCCSVLEQKGVYWYKHWSPQQNYGAKLHALDTITPSRLHQTHDFQCKWLFSLNTWNPQQWSSGCDTCRPSTALVTGVYQFPSNKYFTCTCALLSVHYKCCTWRSNTKETCSCTATRASTGVCYILGRSTWGRSHWAAVQSCCRSCPGFPCYRSRDLPRNNWATSRCTPNPCP